MTSSKQIISMKFREFCGHCSLNGLYYFSSHHPWPVYVVWMALVAASAGLCGYLGNMIWEKFVIDPTFTVVQTTHYSTSNVEFPAVTVCDEEVVYGPATNNITHILESREYTREQIANFYRSFMYTKSNYNPEPYIKKMHSILRELGFTIEDLLQMFHKPCEVLLVSCTWRSQDYNCSTMFREVNTHNGHCCEFTIGYFMLHADKETIFLSGTEVADALTFNVNGHKLSFDGNLTDGYVLLYVHDTNVPLSISHSPITITPSEYFDVSIESWVIDASDDVKTLPLQSRRCLIKSDNLKTGDSYEECSSTLILNKAATACRCLPFNYSAQQLYVDDYPACTWERLFCVHQTIAKVRTIRDKGSEKECLPRCDLVYYETEVEHIRNDRTLSFHHRSDEDENMKQNFSTIIVHFDSNTCIKYRTEVLYTWDQVLANLGGIFGLCLGGSIISIIEIVWFIVDLLFTLIVKASKRKIRARNNQKRIFALNNKEFKVKG